MDEIEKHAANKLSTYIIKYIWYSEKLSEQCSIEVVAETRAKAVYKAYRLWKEAYRPQWKAPFISWLKYIFISVYRKEG